MPTEHHGWNKPSQGATDWHTLLNTNFENIDTAVEIRDESANKSNYYPELGAKFLETDTGITYLGDAFNWIRVQEDVGASVYRSSNLFVAANTTEQIVFDAEVDDQRGEYDTGTGTFTCAYPGAYKVDAMVSPDTNSLVVGLTYEIQVIVNGTIKARNPVTINSEGANWFPSHGVSKALHGLTKGDEIEVYIQELSGDGFDVYGNDESWTYLTIHQIS